jgi:hypothetical protein
MAVQQLGPRLGARRERIFAGFERPIKIDRNLRVRIIARAQALSRKVEKGKHYGSITGKDIAVLRALLFEFLNWNDGRCFPSYEKISIAADCCRSHVATALKRIEAAGLLTWVNRLKWVRESCRDLFGRDGVQKRVHRTSNSYRFFDPGETPRRMFTAKSKFSPRTAPQDSSSHKILVPTATQPPNNDLQAALQRFREAFERKKHGDRA